MNDFGWSTCNPADESCGIRDIGNDLYESVPLLSLQEDAVGDNPRVNSLAHENVLYIAIDHHFWIISDIESGTVDFTHKFSNTIDAFTLVDDLLLVGLGNGEVHLINVHLKEIIASCCVNENVWYGDKFIIGMYQEVAGSQIFLVLTKKGQFYRVYLNEDTKSLHSDLLVDISHNITTAAYSNGLLLAAGSKLIVYDLFFNMTHEIACNNISLKSVWPASESIFLGLKSDGTLCRICCSVLLIADMPTDERIQDMVFYNHVKKSYLYYVTVESEPKIKMVEYLSEQQHVFNMDIENFIHLVMNQHEDDNQIYLARYENCIRLNIIRETKPEDRYQRLIRKMLYKEAEIFAQQYNLSRLDIDKAKVANIVDKCACTDVDISEMLSLMGNIPDVHFKVKSCQSAVAVCETIEGIERILSFLAALNYNEINDRPLQLILNSMVTSFDTYKTLTRCENVQMTVNGYHHFIRSNYFEYLCGALRKRKIETAIIIFSRLDYNDFTCENITSILGNLGTYNLDEFTSFAYTMIPLTLVNCPDALNICAEAIIAKVHAIERNRREEECFPERTITFVDEMLRILNGETALRMQMSTKEEDVKAMDLIEHLINISKCLNTILELKNNYDIFLPLQDCLAGPGAMLRSMLSMRIKCVEKFLKNFLIKFMVRNNFDADAVLAQEIDKLLKGSDDYWMSDVPQVWKCISSTTTQLQLLLRILRAAPKPWCGDIRQMMNEALDWNHPLVTEVQCEAKNEPIYIVLYRSEYGLRNETLKSIAGDTFAIQRIIYCNLPTMIQDVYTLCSTPESKNTANLLLLCHFIDSDDLNNVFDLVNTHTIEERKRYLPDLCHTYSDDNILHDAVLRRTLIESLTYIAEKSDSAYLYEEMLDAYKIIDVLPSHLLSMDIFNKCHSKTGRQDVLNSVIRELSLDTEDFNEFLKQSKRFARVFRLPHTKIIFEVCLLANDISFIYKCALQIYENSTDVETLSLTTVLILRQIGIDREDMHGTFFNDTVQNDDMGKPVDEELLSNCLKIGRNICARSYLLSDGDLKVARVFRWANNTVNLKKTDENSSNICTMNAVQSTFSMYCEYIKFQKSPGMDYLTYSFPCQKGSDTSDFEDTGAEMSKGVFCRILMQRLQNMEPAIIRENQHWTLLHMLITLQGQLGLFTEPVLQGTIGKFKGKFLTTVFSAPEINESLTFSLLLSYPKDKAFKIINDAMKLYRMNFTKFEAIVKLGMRLTNFYKTTDYYAQYMLGIKWRKALTACTLPLKTFFLTLAKNALLEPLITQNEITLEQITSFCKDFKLNAQDYYIQYLNHLIATWQPKYEVRVDPIGNRTLFIQNDEEDLTSKCLKVVPLINNRDAVLKCVDTLWNTTNFYHYEVFIAILSIAAILNDARHYHFRVALLFLKDYQRTSKPSAVETDEWCARFLHKPLDAISEWRFPFSPMLFTPDLWKILRNEINLSNYEKWFKLADEVLKHLNCNEICSIVVKCVELVSNDQIAPGNYNLQPMFEDIFVEIDKCLAHITDPELAASMAFHLISKPPEGADRVNASKLAYKYAKICKDSGVNSSNYYQIQKGFYTYSSKHILHVHNLDAEKYLALLDSPSDLINALYKDERIINRSNACLSQCPNINKATDEIGALFQIDMRSKRIELLNMWLNSPNTLLEDVDQSICLMPDMNDACEQNFECILRAAYLCTGDDVSFWCDHLQQMFENTAEFLVQGRVLKTLCMIASPEELNERFDCPYESILQTIDKFFVVHDLRSLGIMVDIEQFSNISKSRLLYKLGKKLSDSISIKVMTAVCDIYKIYDLSVWEKVIQGMIKLNMINELKKCLTMFMKENIMLCSVVYFNAWQAVVDNTFASLETTEQDFDTALMDLVHFVQSSPVLNRLDLSKGLKICMIRKKYAFALLFLQYVPAAVRDEKLAELLRRNTKQDLLASLEKLRYRGVIGLQFVSEMVQQSP